MTPEILVIAVIRIAASLPVLRWPLAGGVLAILADLSDLLLRDALDLGGVGDYQALDKWLDQVYLATFLIVALRWAGPARVDRGRAVRVPVRRLRPLRIDRRADAAARLPECLRVLVPARRGGRTDSRGRLVAGTRWRAVLLALTAAKEAQEWAIHGGRLFDGISSLEFLDLVRRRLTGG